MPKGRVFNIMQYVNHPDTGDPLLDEDTIKVALAHKTIKQWAYILHDKDVYSQADEEDDPTHEQGKVKPPHWHIVLNCSQQVEVGTIAKWFGIAENFVDIPKGLGAGKLLDCVEYLTHESVRQQELGKHRYDDNEVHASEGFNWRLKLDRRNENKLKYGKDLTDIQQMCYEVMYNGMTLKEAESSDRLLYMDNVDKLNKLRLEYLRRQKPPGNRINIYLYGKGGSGKDLMSRALARALYPDIKDDEDIFFTVGAGTVTFDGYDGQPVLIWSDRRAGGLIKALGGRENLFNVFETHPTKQRQNIKYGSVTLNNEVNIVNGQETYWEFLDGIAGEYVDREGITHEAEDKNQGYRRFPIILPLHEEDFDLLINKGYLENNREWFQDYYAYRGIRGNMQRIVQKCGGENELSRKAMARALKVVTDKYGEMIADRNGDINEDDILQWLETEGIGNQRYTSGCDLIEAGSQGFEQIENTEEVLPDFNKPDVKDFGLKPLDLSGLRGFDPNIPDNE